MFGTRADPHANVGALPDSSPTTSHQGDAHGPSQSEHLRPLFLVVVAAEPFASSVPPTALSSTFSPRSAWPPSPPPRSSFLPLALLYSFSHPRRRMSVRAPPPLSGAQKSLQNGPTSPSAAVTKLLPQTPPSWPGRLPSLHLYPLSADSVGPRAIYLPPDGTRVSSSPLRT